MQKIAVLASWLASLVRGVRKRSQQAARRTRLAARSSYKLEIVVLEDRIVPSTFTFTQLNYSVFPDYPDRPANRMTLESEEGGTIAVTRDTTGTAETVNYATADGSVGESVYGAASGTLEFGTDDTTKYFDVGVTNAGTSGLYQYFLVHLFDPNDESETPTPLDTAVVTFFEPTYEQDIVATAADLTYHVGQNQTLSVDAHFGLLQTAYNPWGDTLTISSNSSPDQEGASLSVDSTGKFDYIPPTDWTGTDTFTVTLNDGYDDTNTATITIVVVPTGESVEYSDPIYVNNGGKLQCTEPGFPGDSEESRNSMMTTSEEQPAAPASRFTINTVPFSPAGGAQLAFILPAFGSNTRITEMRAETNVPLSAGGPVRVLSRIQNFKLADGVELASHIGHVRQDLEPAIEHLGVYFSDSSESGAVDRWFADSNDFGGGLSNSPSGDVATIQQIYSQIAAGLDGATAMIYRDDPTDANNFGWATKGGTVGTDRITLGGLYHQSAPTVATSQRARYGTIIHELSHFFGRRIVESDSIDVEDNGYLDEADSPTTFWTTDRNRVTWHNGLGTTTFTLTTAEMIQNADSYAGFLSQFYFHW